MKKESNQLPPSASRPTPAPAVSRRLVIHEHLAMQAKLGIPQDYVIIDREVFEAMWMEFGRSLRTNKPRIVCLCGSTRFKDAFDEANYQETMSGKIVLSVGFFMHASRNRHGGDIGATPKQKVALDELHKRKIDLADEVFVLNVGGYIGESTRDEIEYAKFIGRPIRYLEEGGASCQ